MLSQPTPPTTPTITVPHAIAQPRFPSLTEQVLNHIDGPLQIRNAATVSTGLQNLWIAGIGLTAAIAITGAIAAPKQWIPIAYAGSSVAISLSIGAGLQRNRSKALQSAAMACDIASPVLQTARDYVASPERQLRGFEKRVAEILADDWAKQNGLVSNDAVTVPALPESPPISPAVDLGTNPQSCLIAGVPGAGKGVFYLAALAELSHRHPEIAQFIIDPKASQQESGVLNTKATVWRSPLSEMSPDDGAEWVLHCIERFKAHQGKKVLVIDELASIMATLKLSSRKLQAAPSIRAFLSHITSMGDGEGHYLWLVTQDASTDGLGISSALRATLRAIGIISPSNRQALSAFLAGQWLPLPDGGRDDLDTIMESSEVGRAIFDGKVGRWMPAPRLTNLTGFDRDNRQPLLTPQPVQNRLEGPSKFWDEEYSPDEVEATTGAVAVADEESMDESIAVWVAWIKDKGGSVTVRKAQQSAPSAVRTNSAGTTAVFEELERLGLGTFDTRGREFRMFDA